MTGFRILHIEDDTEFQLLVRLVLRSLAQIVSVDSLAGARERLKDERFDLMILDGELPDGSGLSLLDDGQLPESLPVILFSGRRWRDAPKERIAAAFVKSESTNEQLIGAVTKLLN